MNLNARELISQVIQVQTMSFGLLMMVDMETTNASWVNKYHTLEEDKNQSALTEKSLKEKS